MFGLERNVVRVQGLAESGRQAQLFERNYYRSPSVRSQQ